MFDLRTAARQLGGIVCGNEILCPGPSHKPRDRSLSVRISASAPLGFICHSFCGDDFRACQRYVAERLRIDPAGWRMRQRAPPPRPPVKAVDRSDDAEQRRKARWLWRQRRSIAGWPAEIYLRQARAYTGVIPATLAYLPPRGDQPHALIAAFGVATEPESGKLAITDAGVRAVQIIRLRSDGSGKADVEPQKLIIGRGALGSPVMLAPPNDLLGLAICEGIEDALSIHVATGLGAWASGGAGRMPALADAVPSYVECVSIFGDDDDAGRRSATSLAARLRTRGFEVILKFLARPSS
jgi:hypothetical protein